MNMLNSEALFRPAHSGWSQEEDKLLFAKVKEAREQTIPLKAVFASVAQATGRQPNSIRNYYYTRIKQNDLEGVCVPHSPAFVPFTPEEMEELLKTVLQAQAQGISVRTCTLNMGGGNNRAMLRYQNKYRSLIKNNPALVKKVIRQMQENGQPVFDPYQNESRMRKVGRPRKNAENLLDIMSHAINELSAVDDLDVAAFFEGLGTLALSASRGATAQKKLAVLEGAGTVLPDADKMDDAELLNEQIFALRRELDRQRERFTKLLRLFKQLMTVNRDFLHMTSVVKVSNLSSYIRDLERNVEDCEKVMVEYV